MAEVLLRNVVKRFDNVEVVRNISLDIPDNEFVVLVGPSGCGKIDNAAHDRGARGNQRRRHLYRRRSRQRSAAERPRHRDGVPELRALPAHVGVREHVVRAEAAQILQGRDQEARRPCGPHPRHHRASRPQAEGALRRPAPARGDGPRHRAQSEGVPVRRAAVEPRRQAARADAHRNQARAPEGEDHHGLRHARPGRGDDAGRPRRGHERRRDRADRHAAGPLPSSAGRASSRASSARRR